MTFNFVYSIYTITIKPEQGAPMKNNVKIIKVGDDRLNKQINEGVTYDREIKRLQTLLVEIKESFADLDPGKYMTDGGNTVTISEAPKYSAIVPEEAKKALREKRLGKNFMSCVSIGVTKLKRFLSDEELEGLRSIESHTRKYSFK